MLTTFTFAIASAFSSSQTPRMRGVGALLALVLASAGCLEGSLHIDDGSARDDPSDDPGDDDAGTDPGDPPPPPPDHEPGTFPTGNAYSWDGSWTPGSDEFPMSGLLDAEYGDGHGDTPILPPGAWDYDDSNDDLANWRNFEGSIGSFEPLRDEGEQQFGWRLVGNDPDIVFAGAADYFHGSSGTDVIDLGAAGTMNSFVGSLGGGPDILVFDSSYALDFRTGSSLNGSANDNDLVVAGCDEDPSGAWDINTTTIHTGPGHDWVFVRDWDRAAIDLGNGADGRTDTLDPTDGDDLVVIRGNAHDFRVFGGEGDDTAVWYLDEGVQTTMWLGPNFFGGGGDGGALWDDGTDRLVLAVPTSTELVTESPTPEGSLLVRGTDGGFIPDDPTQYDDFARYCVECGQNGEGRRTLILEYHSADGAVFTGYFFVTAFEEVQVGVGEGARVYSIDDIEGALTLNASAEAYLPPVVPDEYCQ